MSLLFSPAIIGYMRKILTAVCFGWMLLGIACGGNENKEKTPVPANEKPADSAKATPATATRNIVFLGNSLTAGYGLDISEAFPAIIQEKVDSLRLPYKVINAGLSGETTAGGRNRIDWILQQKVDIFVLELGGNDGLRGIPVSETASNLQFMIDRVKAKYPKAQIILAGMQIPPNMGSKYAGEFRAIFKRLADTNKVSLIPFLLEGVGGIPELNQSDGIHPTARGHKIVAENVWTVLKDML
jgi:acyl-CoA thioesterase-1